MLPGNPPVVWIPNDFPSEWDQLDLRCVPGQFPIMSSMNNIDGDAKGVLYIR